MLEHKQQRQQPQQLQAKDAPKKVDKPMARRCLYCDKYLLLITMGAQATLNRIKLKFIHYSLAIYLSQTLCVLVYI